MATISVDDEIQPQKALQARVEIERIATIAILAVGFGFAMQALVLATRLLAGGTAPEKVFVADLTQGVTWSLFVCTGVAIGVAVGRARKFLAGIFGLVFAPLGIAAAKASQKAVTALTNAVDKPDLVPLVTLGSVRAVEYGLLAWLLAILAEKEIARPGPYLGVGAITGVVFGGLLVFLSTTTGATPPTTAQLAGMIVNEVGFPIGCALLIFLGQLVARNLVIYKRHSVSQPESLAH